MTLSSSFRQAGPEASVDATGQVDVLLIDDSADVRSLLERTLAHAGYSVRSCSDGHGALKLLSQQSFRLVVTDIYMPGMDGYEVIMKVNATLPRPQVLAISGGTMSVAGVNLRVAKNLGCQRVLAKPFDLPDFYALVREMIGSPIAQTDPVPVI
jgi:two-component system cell cycle response regulator CpdR